jgi:hypothetical protein
MDTVDGGPVASPDQGAVSWSRRYRTNLERLASGDQGQIVEVVQQLADRERTVGISSGERRMLARARKMLDDLGDDPSGVCEPRRPSPGPHTGRMSRSFEGTHGQPRADNRW